MRLFRPLAGGTEGWEAVVPGYFRCRNGNCPTYDFVRLPCSRFSLTSRLYPRPAWNKFSCACYAAHRRKFWNGSREETMKKNHAAVPRRPCRQLPALRGDHGGARKAGQGPDQRGRLEEDRGPGDSEGHQEAGRGRPQARDRRRIPPLVVAFRFLRHARRRRDLRARSRHPVPGRADQAAEHPREGQDRLLQPSDARALQVPESAHQGDAEDVHPGADGDALPARAGSGRQKKPMRSATRSTPILPARTARR